MLLESEIWFPCGLANIDTAIALDIFRILITKLSLIRDQWVQLDHIHIIFFHWSVMTIIAVNREPRSVDIW